MASILACNKKTPKYTLKRSSRKNNPLYNIWFGISMVKYSILAIVQISPVSP